MDKRNIVKIDKTKFNTFKYGLVKRKNGSKIELKFYDVWHHLKDRCLVKTNKKYKVYGGRGIKIEWNDFSDFYNEMFSSYLVHLEKYGLKNTTLDRIDVNGNYSKSNCRWATNKVQANNKTNTVWIENNDKKQTLAQLAEQFNISYKSLWNRIKILKMPIERALVKKDYRLS